MDLLQDLYWYVRSNTWTSLLVILVPNGLLFYLGGKFDLPTGREAIHAVNAIKWFVSGSTLLLMSLVAYAGTGSFGAFFMTLWAALHYWYLLKHLWPLLGGRNIGPPP